MNNSNIVLACHLAYTHNIRAQYTQNAHTYIYCGQ